MMNPRGKSHREREPDEESFVRMCILENKKRGECFEFSLTFGVLNATMMNPPGEISPEKRTRRGIVRRNVYSRKREDLTGKENMSGTDS